MRSKQLGIQLRNRSDVGLESALHCVSHWESRQTLKGTMDDDPQDREFPRGAAEPRVGLPVRLRTVARPEQGERAEASTVHCPVIQGSRSVEHCMRCPRFKGLGRDERGVLVHCRPGSGIIPTTDLADAVNTTPTGELLGAEVMCLDCELAASKAAELLQARGVRSAPVVDDHGVLIGVVEVSALRRACEDAETLRGYALGATAPEVEDAMTYTGAALSESASIAQAARLMATRGVESVTVVSQDQQVLGVLTAMDLVRWLATLGG